MSGDDERKDPPLGPLEETNVPGDEEKMEPSPRLLEPIPKKERPDVLDPISRPSVSASRPQEVRFQRERRKLSETSARKTITDHSKDSEPMSAAERADLSAAIARKTVNFNTNTPLVPLSMKERRELVRSISIVVREPETPSWFSEGLDDVEEEGEGKKEEEEAVDKKEVAEPSRAPEGSGDGHSGAPPDESTAPPPALRRASTRLTRVPTKRVFPTPSTKDEERLNPFSKKERRALVRSLSMAVVAPSTPVIWDRDPADASESEEGQSIDKPEFAPPPPDLDELRTKPKVQKSGKRHRTVRVHVSDLARSHAVDSLEFCNNKVKSAKYSLSSFIPMNLFMQCCRAANLYFILIAALQLIPGFSPTSWGTTVAPLAFVLLLNAVKEAIDDFKRNLSDRSVNKQKVEVMNERKFLQMNWSSVVVGDIVRVKCDHEFPADLVFLSSSDSKGLAYVETSNLDGEPSLKMRSAFYKGSQTSADDEDESSLSIFSGLIIECELPNNRLYKFDGAINLQDYGKLPLDNRQILLRGATLRNTEWILGVVVYTGADTKFVRNMIPGRVKVTELERNVNILVAMVFLALVAICIGLAVAQDSWARKNPTMYYLSYDIYNVQLGVLPSEIGAQFGRFLILLNQLIPQSLYVTLEIVKVVQSFLLDHDLQMYHNASKTYARARTTSLNEELGQVQYVMTDKTGTLTQNLMAFVQCSINGKVYGSPVHAPLPESAPTIHRIVEDEVLQAMLKKLAEGSKEPDAMFVHSFLSHLAICHVIQPVLASDADPAKAANKATAGQTVVGTLRYTGASPDEEALVQGAADCGYRLTKRTTDELHVDIPGQGSQKFAILATLEFTSERKRMSIICKDSKGRIKLYCKGADSVIFKRLGGDQDEIILSTLQQLEEFARYGFRTLCMAEREISRNEYEQWAGHFRSASVALDERDEKVAAVAEEIERDMTLLGATAVEDKLQAGVPETITVLALANIRVWVLTGDKLETSVSVALSCNLLADSMHLFLLSDLVQQSVPQMLRSMLDEARRQEQARLTLENSYHSDMATVIEGHSLSVALEDSNKLVFLELCQLCRSVICCRVSPFQKAQVTRLVREQGKGICLAIGDGANDVGMLKVAQIGVGIGGREGMAAVLASDYAISRFRHLRRLLLVHGRWSYKRNREVVMYAFYKNYVYVLGNIYLAFLSGFSAQSLYSAAEITTYNLLWTALPSLLFALLDKDTSDCTAENNPQLFLETQSERRGQFLWCMLGWGLAALWDSLVAFFLPLAAVHTLGGTGESADIYTLGSTIFTIALITVNLKQFFRMHNYTWLHFFSFHFSTWVWILVLYLFSALYKYIKTIPDLSGVGVELVTLSNFWLLLLLCPITALLPGTAFEVFHNRYAPLDSQIMREIEHGWMDGFFFDDAPDFVEHIPTTEPEYDLPGLDGQGPSPLHQEIADARQAAMKDGGAAAEGDKADGESGAEDGGTPRAETEVDDRVLQPRRLTWREVTNEDDLEDLHRADTLGRFGRRRSSGFQIVTRYTDASGAPVPLVHGPAPPQRKSVVPDGKQLIPLKSGASASRSRSRFSGEGGPKAPPRRGRGAERAAKKKKETWLDLAKVDASPIERMRSRTDSLKPPSSPRLVVAHAPRSSKLHARPSRYVDSHPRPAPPPSSRSSSPAPSPRAPDSSSPGKFPKSSYETPTHSPRRPHERKPLSRSRLS